MHLSHLKAFYEVARHGSFSRAAEGLFTSQPALSRQVAALEKDLGLDLLSRQPRGVVPTEAGRRLAEYAERIFRLLAEAERAVSDFKNLETGSLTLGASTTIGNYLLPPLLAAYQRDHPGIEVSLHVKSSREIEAMLAKREIDFGLLAEPVTDMAGLYVEPFGADELVGVTAPTHPLAREKNPALTVLEGETLLLREQGSATRRAVEEYLAGRGIQPGKIFVLGNTEAAKRVAAHGLGIAFLSRFTLEPELECGKLHLLGGPEWRIQRRLLLAYPKDSRLSPPALAFLVLLRKQACKFNGYPPD